MANHTPTFPLNERALVQELMDVLLQCESPRHIKHRAVDAVEAARKLIDADMLAFAAPAITKQGWSVCAKISAARLIDDLMRTNREATALESMLYLPLIEQARLIHNQLAAIEAAIDRTPGA